MLARGFGWLLVYSEWEYSMPKIKPTATARPAFTARVQQLLAAGAGGDAVRDAGHDAGGPLAGWVSFV